MNDMRLAAGARVMSSWTPSQSRTMTTGWWWVALVASVVALAAAAVSVRSCGSWPEMGSRYDAPVARPRAEEMDDVDLWRAIDQGRDPTDPGDD